MQEQGVNKDARMDSEDSRIKFLVESEEQIFSLLEKAISSE
jgi:DNA replication initiation complex subunit (GINS family)